MNFGFEFLDFRMKVIILSIEIPSFKCTPDDHGTPIEYFSKLFPFSLPT